MVGVGSHLHQSCSSIVSQPQASGKRICVMRVIKAAFCSGACALAWKHLETGESHHGGSQHPKFWWFIPYVVLTVESLLFIVKSPVVYRKLSEKKWKARPMTHDLQHPTPDKATVHWPVAPAVSSRSAGTRASFAYHFDQTSVATPLGLTLPRESAMFSGFVQKIREHPIPMDDHHFSCYICHFGGILPFSDKTKCTMGENRVSHPSQSPQTSEIVTPWGKVSRGWTLAQDAGKSWTGDRESATKSQSPLGSWEENEGTRRKAESQQQSRSPWKKNPGTPGENRKSTTKNQSPQQESVTPESYYCICLFVCLFVCLSVCLSI